MGMRQSRYQDHHDERNRPAIKKVACPMMEPEGFWSARALIAGLNAMQKPPEGALIDVKVDHPALRRGGLAACRCRQ